MWVLMLLQHDDIGLWSFGTSCWMTRWVLLNTVRECVTFIFLWNVKNHLPYDAASYPRWLPVILIPYVPTCKQGSVINCKSITVLSCIITKKDMENVPHLSIMPYSAMWPYFQERHNVWNAMAWVSYYFP
jgi:hypothetical protein